MRFAESPQKATPTLLKAISIAVILIAQLFPTAPPTVDQLDANARASGNRKDIAVSIGRALFRTRWPAQVLNVYADVRTLVASTAQPA